MTKEEFKRKFIASGTLTWDKTRDTDFDFMYNRFHFTDSDVAEIFEVPMEKVTRKRIEWGTSVKKEDYATWMIYKQQGYLKWDEISYSRFDYLYKWCDFSDSFIADLFAVPKRTVTTKRKEWGISLFGPGNARNNVSSYLDFNYVEPSEC